MNACPAAVESMDTYWIFNSAIRSQIPLPELPLCEERDPVIHVCRETFDEQHADGFTVRHDWRREGGPVICTSARRGTHYRLTFPDRASFYILPCDTAGTSGGVNQKGVDNIVCSASPGCSEGVVRQLLLSQVIPRFLAHRGALLLHASAVTLPTGKTVAFLGESGQGKSTLASYCQRHGAQLIDDDCVLLQVEGRQVSIIGGVPSVRLYPDSVRALGLGAPGPGVSALTDSTPANAAGRDKQQLSLMAVPTGRPQPRVLDALLLLDHPAKTSGGAAVCIRPATGQAAMMALLHGAFQLDPTEASTMPRVFSQAAAVLSGCAALPVHRLCYPRRHDRLPDVLQSVLDFQPA